MNFTTIFGIIQTIIRVFPTIQTVIAELSGVLRSSAPAPYTGPAVTEQPSETVKGLQQLLNQYIKPSPNLVVDGVYGPATDKAIKQGLTQLGIKL